MLEFEDPNIMDGDAIKNIATTAMNID